MRNFIIRKEIIDNGETLYEVLRIIKENRVKTQEDREAWKNYIHADIVFKKGEHFYFCRTIQDAEIINDDIESSIDSIITSENDRKDESTDK